MPNGQVTLSKKIDKVEGKIDQVLAILLGDPEKPEAKGVIERLRNAEDWQKEVQPRVSRMWGTYVPVAWIMGIAIVTTIGLLVKLVFEMGAK